MTERRRRIDMVSDPVFLADVELMPTTEVRRRRQMVGELETELSYQRRLIHARLDIVSFERRRRTGNETRTVLEALDEILADAALPARQPVAGNLATPLPPHAGRGRRRIDRILHDAFVIRLAEMDATALDEAVATLQEAETEVAEHRQRAQAVYDALGAEISRRYRLGLTSVDELLEG